MTKTSYLPVCLEFFFFPLFLSFFLTGILIKFSKRFNMFARQKKERWNKKRISNLGGIGIFLSFLIPFIIIGGKHKSDWYLLFPLFLIFAMGLYDDFYNLKPFTKIIFQMIIGLFFIDRGFFFPVSGIKLIDYAISLIWILGIINAFNLIDNIDGLSAGIAIICSISLLSFSILQNNAAEAVISLSLSACAFGFLIFNLSPAKIFMGNSGSYFVGTSFSLISIKVFSHSQTPFLLLALFLSLIFFVPIFDTLFVFFRRISSNKLFYHGGCDHISHALVDLGLSERKTVLLLYAINLICVLMAFLINFLGRAS
jgi:UDP-GlcNAc:undecaprenyl-phosphate GlcNAc-1-phosphate transferase